MATSLMLLAGLLTTASAASATVRHTATAHRPATVRAVPLGAASPTAPGEVTSLRTQMSDTYLLAGGGYRTIVGVAPLNYQDGTGAWQPVDNTLTGDSNSGYAARNTAGSYNVEFPPSLGLGSQPIKMTFGATWLAFAPVGAAGTLSTSGSTATYTNALTDVDVSYQVGSDGTQELLPSPTPPPPAPSPSLSRPAPG